jgi:carbon-monoxide dehydrogenase small subunit
VRHLLRSPWPHTVRPTLLPNTSLGGPNQLSLPAERRPGGPGGALGVDDDEIAAGPRKQTHVRTTINGEPREFLCEPLQSLLECLRDILGLTGSKEGCNDGNCGACTVVLDGRIVNSCLVLGVEAAGSEITTIEGVARGSELHPVQRAFLEQAALQCGFCTPGFIVAAKALLDQEAEPSEERVRLWLANNLCRCTGYDKIVRAVHQAAGER